MVIINQVAKTPKDAAKQQLVSTNLQPTNLLFHHNALNSGANTAGTGKHAGGKKITGHISEQHKHNHDKYMKGLMRTRSEDKNQSQFQ